MDSIETNHICQAQVAIALGAADAAKVIRVGIYSWGFDLARDAKIELAAATS